MKKALTKLGVGSVIALGLAINPLTGVQAVFAASDASNFEGINIQAGVGYQGTSAKVDSITNNGVGGLNINGASLGQANGSSVAATLGLGYTKALTDSFTLGIEAEYNGVPSQTGSADFKDSTGSALVTNANKFTLSNQMSVSLIPGFAVSPDTLIYAKVGYAMATLKSNDQSTPAIFGSSNLNGILLGLGAKMNFSKNVYGFAEANAVQYGSASTSGNLNRTNPVSVIPVSGSAKVNSYNGLVGVGYRF